MMISTNNKNMGKVTTTINQKLRVLPELRKDNYLTVL